MNDTEERDFEKALRDLANAYVTQHQAAMRLSNAAIVVQEEKRKVQDAKNSLLEVAAASNDIDMCIVALHHAGPYARYDDVKYAFAVVQAYMRSVFPPQAKATSSEHLGYYVGSEECFIPSPLVPPPDASEEIIDRCSHAYLQVIKRYVQVLGLDPELTVSVDFNDMYYLTVNSDAATGSVWSWDSYFEREDYEVVPNTAFEAVYRYLTKELAAQI